MMPFVLAFVMQVSAAQAPNVFHAESRLVVVDVTVHGAGGAIVTNLDQSAFTIYEDGKRQPIAIFMGENVPVSVGIVIDNSGSMRERRAKVEAAALAFARASNPMDEMFVVNFADKARIDVPLTSDVKAIEAGVARADAIGGTALRDAIDLAETYLVQHATRDRKVLLVITDGNDNASTISADRVRQQAQQHGIAVYAIGLPHQNPSMAAHARRELDDLTESTGGLARHVASIDEADATAVDLAREIRQQYTVAYSPLNPALDGSYRKIRVAVKTPERVSVRTRAGYFATPGATRGQGR
jgi:VWFA-related protein